MKKSRILEELERKLSQPEGRKELADDYGSSLLSNERNEEIVHHSAPLILKFIKKKEVE